MFTSDYIWYTWSLAMNSKQAGLEEEVLGDPLWGPGEHYNGNRTVYNS
jgi:hypothetical protein